MRAMCPRVSPLAISYHNIMIIARVFLGFFQFFFWFFCAAVRGGSAPASPGPLRPPAFRPHSPAPWGDILEGGGGRGYPSPQRKNKKGALDRLNK